MSEPGPSDRPASAQGPWAQPQSGTYGSSATWERSGHLPPTSPGEPTGGRSGGRGGGPGWLALISATMVAAVVGALVTLGLTSGERTSALDERLAERNGTAVVEPTQVRDEGAAPPDDPLPAGSSVADVAEAVLPSVARVDVVGAQGQGAGSAVVYSSDGLLVTNNHVIAEASDVEVTLSDGESFEAEVLGADPTSDLAVLEIDADGLPEIPLATESPRVGDTVIAVGSPFGLDATVTTGIVSAADRLVPVPGQDQPLVGMLQTDAAINPGNSGGALVNAQGELVGINTAILSATGQSGGIGFAAPTETVESVVPQLLDQGFVEYALLGVQTQPVNARIERRLGLDSSAGAAVVAVVEGSAADKAGIEVGDVILVLGDEEIATTTDLLSAVRGYQPGDSTSVVVNRDGDEQTLDVTFGAVDDNP